MNKRLALLSLSVALGATHLAYSGTQPAYGNLTGTCTTTSLVCSRSLTIPAGTALDSSTAGPLMANPVLASSGACSTAPTGWDGALGVGLVSGAGVPVAGLNLNPANCNITGIPTATTKGTQTVGIRNATGSTDAAPAFTSFWLTVTPTSLAYPQNPILATAGVQVSDIPTINATGVTNAITYSVLPTLPAGLILNSSTGAITGTPTTVTAATNYVITASVTGADTHIYTTSATVSITTQAATNYSLWKYTQPISVNTSGMALVGNVVNYPLVVKLTGSNYPVGAAANGADIRFSVLRNGVQVNLPYEIEQLDGSANGVIWVMLDTLYNSTASNAATQSVTMHWGNSAATAPVSDGSKVFSPANGFAAVYHMNADSTGTAATATNTEPDVTGNNLHAAVVGTASTVTTGLLGLGRAGWATTSHLVVNGTGTTPNQSGAQVFGAAANSATPGNPVDLNTGVDYTFSGWVNYTAANTSGNQVIIAKGATNNTNTQWALQTDGGPWENSAFCYKDAAASSATKTAGEPSNNQSASGSVNVVGWQYVVGTETSVPGTTFFTPNNNGGSGGTYSTTSQSMQSLYVNASAPSVGASAYGGFSNIRVNNLPVAIGAGEDNVRPIPGTLDEVRVSTVARSYDWVKADYQTQCQGITPGAYIGGATCVTSAYGFGTIDSSGGPKAPVIATNPASQATTVGSKIFFSTSLSAGTPPFVYKWVHLHGASADTLKTDSSSALVDTLKDTSVAQADTGSYKVVVGNAVNTVASNAATLTVTAGPAITSNPASATVNAGANVKFGVTVANSATTPLVYKWMHVHGGVTDTLKKDTLSLFTDSLALTSVPVADTGSYKVTVSNSAGPATSTSAVLTILTVPGAPTITSAVGASGQVTVTWTAPSSNGGSAITGYTVTASDTSKHCTTTTALSCAVTGLTNTTSYTFTVVASNVVGKGAVATSAPVTSILGFTAKDGFGIQMVGSSMLLRMPSISGDVHVSIMDVWGRTVWNRTVSGNIGQLTWDGRSNHGSSAPVGMYVLRLSFVNSDVKTAGYLQTTFVKP